MVRVTRFPAAVESPNAVVSSRQIWGLPAFCKGLSFSCLCPLMVIPAGFSLRAAAGVSHTCPACWQCPSVTSGLVFAGTLPGCGSVWGSCDPAWGSVRTWDAQSKDGLCSSVLSVLLPCVGTAWGISRKILLCLSSCVPCLLPPEMNGKWKWLLHFTCVLPCLL